MGASPNSATRAVFVSHAHSDNAQCDRYVAALRTHGLDVWYDRTNLQSGTMLSAEIERELQARTAFVVLLSPAAVASYWVKLEIDAYRDLAARDPARLVLPVRIAPCDVPLLLRGLKWIDATGRPFDEVVQDMARTLTAASQERQAPADQAPGQSSLACPRCGQLDQVRKVSSLSSDRRLAAPVNPLVAVRGYDPGLVGVPQAVWSPTVAFFVALAAAILVAVIAHDLAGCLIPLIFLGWVLFLVYASVRFLGQKQRAEQRRQQSIQKVRAQAQDQVPAWEGTMTMWRQLYYCGRDDIVFIPGKPNAVAPAEHIAQVLK